MTKAQVPFFGGDKVMTQYQIITLVIATCNLFLKCYDKFRQK